MTEGIRTAREVVGDTIVGQSGQEIGIKATEKAYVRHTVKKFEGEALEKATAAVVKKGFNTTTKVAQKTIAKKSAKIVAKSGLKVALKKVPLVSLGAGLVFGAGRALQGDWVGAVGEVASGACGCFPGVGTACSCAIDAALIGKDIHDGIKEEKAKVEHAKSPSSNSKQTEVNSKQAERLLELQGVRTPAERPSIQPSESTRVETPRIPVTYKVASKPGGR